MALGDQGDVPRRTVLLVKGDQLAVFAQLGSMSVVEARYFGCLFSAAAIGWFPGSSSAARARSSTPQKPAKSSNVRRPNRNASARR